MHRGGGNSRLTSHNQGFSLIETFNNLALWGENKFVSELKRTYKFQRGVNCHTEDNSPKYRMVGNDVGLESPTDRSSSLRANAKQSRETVITRSEKRRSNLIQNENNEIATFRYTPLAMTEKRLRNKCAMTWNSDMKENNFTDKVYSLFTSHFSLKSAAFTLAEVLVTLGIIGVVSAMTVPTLMQNYQRQSYVTQLHKTYNEFTQAFLQYKNDRNALWLTEAGHTRHQDMMPFMKQYFKVVQECGTTSTPCFASSYKNQNGGTYVVDTLNRGGTYYGVLASGVSFGIMYDALDTGTIYTDDFSYKIVVDINGKKGPNIYGRDLFVMYVFPDGVIDVYYANPACRENNSCLSGKTNVTDWRESVAANCASATGEVWYDGCFARILNDNWQMNY